MSNELFEQLNDEFEEKALGEVLAQIKIIAQAFKEIRAPAMILLPAPGPKQSMKSAFINAISISGQIFDATVKMLEAKDPQKMMECRAELAAAQFALMLLLS